MYYNSKETIIFAQDLSISTVKANFYSIFISVPIFTLFTISYLILWGKKNFFDGIETISENYFYFLVMLIIGLLLHELLHGLSWAYFGQKSLHDIQFGFQLKTLIPYAYCKVPLNIKAYRIGIAIPGIVLGLFPAIIGLVTGIIWTTILGLFFILAATGDILLLWITRKIKVNNLVKDHPKRVGCYVIKIDK